MKTLRKTNKRSNEPARYDEGIIDEYRQHILDVSRSIVSGYDITNPQLVSPIKSLSYPTQLAYLRARNIVNVSQLMSAYYRKVPQDVINNISDEALKVHNWGRDVYWRAIADIQRNSFYLAGKEGVNDVEMTLLCISRLYSQGKINGIEKRVEEGETNARFPGIVKKAGVKLNPFESFEIIRKHYDSKKFDGRFLCKVIELAQRSAVDVLELKACSDWFDSRDYMTFQQANFQYERAKLAHQDRGLAFWEPMHEVDLFCYERACEEKAQPEVLEKLRDKLDKSGEKLSKLDRRHIGTDDERPDSMELMKLMKSIVGNGSSGNSVLDMRRHKRFDISPENREDVFQLLLQSYMDEKNNGNGHK